MDDLKETYRKAFIEQNLLKKDYYVIDIKSIELYIPKSVDYLNTKSNYNKFINRFKKHISINAETKPFHIKMNGKNRNFKIHSITFNGLLFKNKHYKLEII